MTTPLPAETEDLVDQSVAETNDGFSQHWLNDGPWRSLALSAIGAFIGLGLAGYSLFTAKQTSIGRLPPEDIALVNQRPILRSDFLNQTQAEIGVPFKETTTEQRQKVLNEMLDEELLVQRGLEVDLPASDPDVRAALVAGVNLQVDAEILARQPTEAEIKTYFDLHRTKYAGEGTMRIRDLVVAQSQGQAEDERLSTAERASAALTKGVAIENVIADFGLKDSGAIDQRDNFNFAVAAKLGEELYKVAEQLNAGEASKPVRQSNEIHILVMVSRKLPPPVDLASVYDQVWQDVQRENRRRVEQANLTYLKSKADIFVAPGYQQ